jgi:hypothetical protein
MDNSFSSNAARGKIPAMTYYRSHADGDTARKRNIGRCFLRRYATAAMKIEIATIVNRQTRRPSQESARTS